jgi:hypothetical protein
MHSAETFPTLSGRKMHSAEAFPTLSGRKMHSAETFSTLSGRKMHSAETFSTLLRRKYTMLYCTRYGFVHKKMMFSDMILCCYLPVSPDGFVPYNDGSCKIIPSLRTQRSNPCVYTGLLHPAGSQ